MAGLKYNNKTIYPGSAQIPSTAFEGLNTTDSDVVEVWNFDEASGNLTGEVNGTVLTAVGSSAYLIGNGDTDDYSNIKPGIQMDAASKYFKNDTGAITYLNPGTSSFTIECFYTFNNNANDAYLMALYQAAAAQNGVYVQVNALANTITFGLISTNSNNFTKTSSSPTTGNVADSNINHLRLVVDRAADTQQVFFNGENIMNEAAVLDARSINIPQIWINNAWTGTLGADTTMYQMRISHNAMNNGAPV